MKKRRELEDLDPDLHISVCIFRDSVALSTFEKLNLILKIHVLLKFYELSCKCISYFIFVFIVINEFLNFNLFVLVKRQCTSFTV